MKTVSLETLAALVETAKKGGKTVVHCHGVFDLLHIGHIRYFEQAASMGDMLVVTVTPDRFVDKGPYRPAFPEHLRAEAIASLKTVDYVAVNAWDTAEETLKLLKPDIYVKGSEFKNIDDDSTGKIQKEKEIADRIGTRLAFTHDIVFSSSNLINRHLSNLPKETDDYLSLFRTRHRLEDIETCLEKMPDLKVLVIGDTILDEYLYCDPIGMSTKDPVLAVKYNSRDMFAGGVLAVANHVANFAGRVGLATVIGEYDDHREFITSQLNGNVDYFHWTQKKAPTLIKKRYVDGYSFNKLFEIYIMDDSGLDPEEDKRMCDWLESNIRSYDLVIASDFGHGAISDAMVDLLCDKAPFLAVNTQSNSGNRGFHTITRYPRADFVCIAEHEIRLEMRRKKSPVRPMMEKLAERMHSRHFIVTRGRKGNIVLSGNGDCVAIPSFAKSVVDRVGAGDSVLSVLSMASFLDAPAEILGFIGNVVGALAVEIIGNKKSIDVQSVRKFITSLMK